MALRAAEASDSVQGVRPVVLVVDDDHGVRESFRLILEDRYEVLEAADGRQALERLTAVGRLQHLVPVLEDQAERLADSVVVVDDQDDRPYALDGVARLGCSESHGPRNVSRANVYDDLAFARAVALHERDPLPGAEQEPAATNRGRFRGPEGGGLEVGG